jgi:cytoskeletal protein RodZ
MAGKEISNQKVNNEKEITAQNVELEGDQSNPIISNGQENIDLTMNELIAPKVADEFSSAESVKNSWFKRIDVNKLLLILNTILSITLIAGYIIFYIKVKGKIKNENTQTAKTAEEETPICKEPVSATSENNSPSTPTSNPPTTTSSSAPTPTTSKTTTPKTVTKPKAVTTAPKTTAITEQEEVVSPPPPPSD